MGRGVPRTEGTLPGDKRLKFLVAKITGVESDELERTAELKELSRGVKESEEVMRKTVALLFTSLACDDSRRRLSTLRLVDFFFQKSHVFRHLMLPQMERFLQQTLADPSPPPPKAAAKKGRELAALLVWSWVEKYARDYPQLALIPAYLKDVKNIDLKNISEESQLAERMAAERSEREEVERKRRLDAALSLWQENLGDLEDTLRASVSCYQLLFPDPSEGTGDLETAAERETGSVAGEVGHGLTKGFSLSVTVPDRLSVTETEDNSSLLKTLRDCHLLTVRRWQLLFKLTLDKMTKLGAPAGQVQHCLDLRAGLQKAEERWSCLQVTWLSPEEEGESSEEEFEEVADLVLPPDPDQPSTSGIKSITKTTSARLEESEQHLVTGGSGLAIDNWWSSAGGEEEVGGGVVGSYCDFIRAVEPVRRSCRAPLRSGRLCPRRDRLKCPLHGVVIDRDEQGRPSGTGALRTPAPATPDWQNSSLTADISAALGINLDMSAGSRSEAPSSRAGKLKRLGDPVRQRLGKKVFNKRAMTRVATHLNSLETSVAERYQAQFHYQLKN